MAEPIILVKKADGSFVRVPLSQVKKMQGEGKKMPATKDDARPLLDEAVPVGNANLSRVSESRQNQIDSVIKKLSFVVPADYSNRLRIVVQLRLKEIRSNEQTTAALIRETGQAGVGLTWSQADEVIKRCEAAVAASLPAVRGPGALANATPHNAFVHSEVQSFEQARPLSPVAPESFKLNSEPRVKTVMHDVVSRPTEVGPIDEIRYVTLIDFRRLSHNPVEAAARLKQKFVNLQGESILLYLDAWDAWRQSPLYTDYVKLVFAYLETPRPLAKLSADKHGLQLAEISAIVQMEKELSVV